MSVAEIVFSPGQKVKCVAIDDDHPGCTPMLKLGKEYTIQVFFTAAACAERIPDITDWEERGGLVVLEEIPGAEWLGRRFKLVS